MQVDYFKDYLSYYAAFNETASFIYRTQSWLQVPDWIRQQLKDLDELERKRDKMVRWWAKFKRGLSRGVAAKVTALGAGA